MDRRHTRARDFTDVDASGDAREMISYLDDVTRIAAEGKRAGYAALQLQPGMAALDVGCGTGEDVRALAELVGAQGRVAGVDFSQAMIDEAIARGVPANAEYRQASATQLPYADETFDAVRAERVFQHLEHPEAAARELYRVAKPGAVVMLLDQDWETLVVAGSEKALTRKICNAFTDHCANGWAGRNHQGLLKRAGFHDVSTAPYAFAIPYAPAMALILTGAAQYARESGAVSAHDAAQWLADLHMAEERGEFLCAFTFFGVTARR